MKPLEFNLLLDDLYAGYVRLKRGQRQAVASVIDLAGEIALASPEDAKSLLSVLEWRIAEIRTREAEKN
jgi:hypothetical protein